eukprot:jgi/Galph1/2502/GphlegSOOS_G1186.1
MTCVEYQEETQQSLVGSAPFLPLLSQQQRKPTKELYQKNNQSSRRQKTMDKKTSVHPRDKHILEEEEMANLLKAFCRHFPEPPSNLRAQQLIEVNGKPFSASEEQNLWEKKLKPWSDKWYYCKDKFLKMARATFLENDEDFITVELAEKWAESFFKLKIDEPKKALDASAI